LPIPSRVESLPQITIRLGERDKLIIRQVYVHEDVNLTFCVILNNICLCCNNDYGVYDKGFIACKLSFIYFDKYLEIIVAPMLLYDAFQNLMSVSDLEYSLCVGDKHRCMKKQAETARQQL